MNEAGFQSLVNATIEGRITEAEAQELSEAVESSEALLLSLVGQIGMSNLLARSRAGEQADLAPKVLAALRDGAEQDQAVDKVMYAVRRETTPARRAGEERSLRWIPLAAAGFAAILAGWWMVGQGNDGHKKAQKVGAVIAKIEAARGQWTVDSGQWTVARGKPTSLKLRRPRGQAYFAKASKAREVRAGMEIRVGDRVVTGEGGRVALVYEVPSSSVAEAMGDASPDGLRRGTWASVELGGGAILCMPPARPIGPIRPIRPMAHLETGRLTVNVAPQPAGRPFVVETPHAVVLVKGTRFKVDVDRFSSRLETIEGLVNLTRLSDGESVDVAGGWYAVAAEGVELAALALPVAAAAPHSGEEPKPLTHLYGKVLFEDDFSEGLGNWDVLVGTRDTNFEVVSPDNERFDMYAVVTSKYRSRHLPKPILILNRNHGIKNQYVAIRSKRSITGNRFVVEVRRTLGPRGGRGTVFSLAGGIETLSSELLFLGKYGKGKLSAGVQTLRWEFLPSQDSGMEGALVCRSFAGKDGEIFGNASRVRLGKRRILWGLLNGEAKIEKVIVREIEDR